MAGAADAQDAPSGEAAEQAADAWQDKAEVKDLKSAAAALERPEVAQRKQRADAAYGRGRYEEALGMYEQLYELTSEPTFLARVGDCHIRLNHYEAGIESLETYLRLRPGAEDFTLTEDLIQEAVDSINQRQEQAQKDILQGAQQQQLAYQQELNRRLRESLAVQTILSDKTVFERWWFWTIVGTVTLSSVTAALLVSSRNTQTALPTGSLGTVDGR